MNSTNTTPRNIRTSNTARTSGTADRRPRRGLRFAVRTAVVGGLVGFGAVALLGFGSSEDAPAVEAAAPGVDADDVEFAQCMTPHHAQAVEMSVLALDPASGARPEVVDLAQRIHDVQTTEIAMMGDWLAAWGEPLEDSSMGHDVQLMSGMQSDEAMAALAASTGAAFDEAWLEMMVTHHRGGITMSRHAVEDGSDPAVSAAAQAMIAAQTAEIAEMEALLGR